VSPEEPPPHLDSRIGRPPRGIFRAWFIILTAAVAVISFASVIAVDRPLAERLASLDGGVVSLLEKVTLLGSSEPYLIGLSVLGAVLLVLDRWRRLAAATLFTFATIAVSGLAIDAIKVIAGRLRPKLFLEHGLHGLEPFTFDPARHSFPSSHAAVGVGLAIGMGTYFPALRIPLAVVALAIGASRVALELHYLSDVICGAYLAIPAAFLARHLVEALRLGPESI
jgi:membrane-associated phospholipid phosphatase